MCTFQITYSPNVVQLTGEIRTTLFALQGTEEVIFIISVNDRFVGLGVSMSDY